ncbi:MAG: NADH:flavin oxidoreductase, partial [Betaproteobacteria bacterium]
SADEVIEFGARRVVLATGSRWRTDGVGPATPHGIEGLGEGVAAGIVLSPEETVARVLSGDGPAGPAVVWDDDHGHVGHAVAERLRAHGLEVTLVTPLAEVSQWSYYTLELKRIEERLAGAGIRCLTKTRVVRIGGPRVALAGAHAPASLDVACFVPVTLRRPDDALWQALAARAAEWRDAGIVSVEPIGDAVAPGTVAAAVYAGAQAARDLGTENAGGFRRERVML